MQSLLPGLPGLPACANSYLDKRQTSSHWGGPTPFPLRSSSRLPATAIRKWLVHFTQPPPPTHTSFGFTQHAVPRGSHLAPPRPPIGPRLPPYHCRPARPGLPPPPQTRLPGRWSGCSSNSRQSTLRCCRRAGSASRAPACRALPPRRQVLLLRRLRLHSRTHQQRLQRQPWGPWAAAGAPPAARSPSQTLTSACPFQMGACCPPRCNRRPSSSYARLGPPPPGRPSR